jgi:hypothetical protein
MAMSSSEYLRRRVDAMPKVIAPRPVGDASMVTQMRKYAACRGRPEGVRSDGSSVIPSSESLTLSRAGCAVCASPPQKTVEIPCCPYPDDETKQLALLATLSCPCPGSYVTAQLAPRECCPGSGRSNTWKANDMPSGFVGPVAPSQCKTPCRVPAPVEPACDGPVYDGGFNVLYWDPVSVSEPAQNPCGTCHAT